MLTKLGVNRNQTEIGRNFEKRTANSDDWTFQHLCSPITNILPYLFMFHIDVSASNVRLPTADNTEHQVQFTLRYVSIHGINIWKVEVTTRCWNGCLGVSTEIRLAVLQSYHHHHHHLNVHFLPRLIKSMDNCFPIILCWMFVIVCWIFPNKYSTLYGGGIWTITEEVSSS